VRRAVTSPVLPGSAAKALQTTKPALRVVPVQDCEVKTSQPRTDERQKLDQERQCYLDAYLNVRRHLEVVQRAITSAALPPPAIKALQETLNKLEDDIPTGANR